MRPAKAQTSLRMPLSKVKVIAGGKMQHIQNLILLSPQNTYIELLLHSPFTSKGYNYLQYLKLYLFWLKTSTLVLVFVFFIS